MAVKYIITGTGRSGTGYVCEALNQMGIKAGHEKVFTPLTAHGITKPDWGDYEAACSWLALPSLPQKAKVILVIRKPLDTVKSFMDLGFFDHPETGYCLAIRKYCPEVFKWDKPQDQALCFWILWNLMISIHADHVLKLESPTFIRELAFIIGKLPDADVAKDYNNKRERKIRDWKGDWSSFNNNLSSMARNMEVYND